MAAVSNCSFVFSPPEVQTLSMGGPAALVTNPLLYTQCLLSAPNTKNPSGNIVLLFLYFIYLYEKHFQSPVSAQVFFIHFFFFFKNQNSSFNTSNIV